LQGAPHCDPVLGECVGCRFEEDCPENSHCVERSCAAYTPCVNSRDCPEGTVCDRTAGECVKCLQNGDCLAGVEVCVANQCVPTCASDKACLERNQLCHFDKGYCADCVQQQDCPDIYFCAPDDRCKLDVCKAGSAACLPEGLGTCNALGSAYDIVPCPPSTTCTDGGGVASCAPWVCSPGTVDCDPVGQFLKACALDGLSFEMETDCAADGQVCYLGACQDKVCEPGSFVCQGNELRECVAGGTQTTLKGTCGSWQYCDATFGQCRAQNCMPDAPLCDGEVATSCDDVGAGPLPGGTDCSEDGDICFEGECLPELCDGPFCEGQDAYSCLDDGTRAELSETCSSIEFCEAGVCKPDKCTSGNPVCSNNTATVCKADGSGPEPGGTDCGADAVCVDGACKPKICTPGNYLCFEGNPYHCNNTGTGPGNPRDTCFPSEYCNPTLGWCVEDQCTAGAKVCDGTRATTCAADGSGPAAGGTNCAATNKVCANGTCLPKICEPNQYYCQDGNVFSCGSSGATSSLADTCQPSEFCKAGISYCQLDVCTANAPTCNGEKLSTCASDGSGPKDAGTACPKNQTCHAGACKPVICTLDELSCMEGNVQKCVENGTAWSLYSTCSASNYCNELASPIACAPDTCAPGEKTCNGEKLATCADDGGHYSSTGTNCAATKKVCTLAGTCLAVAEDTVADASSMGNVSNYGSGNVYRIDRARSLTEIEQYVSVTGTSLFTWVVYELSGSYLNKVFELTTSNTGSAVFHSSGAIDVALEAGKTYWIGVYVQGTHTRFYQSTSAQPFVSFGRVMSSFSFSDSSAAQSYYYSGATNSTRFHQRLSTSSP
jgi:hypothetical protein